MDNTQYKPILCLDFDGVIHSYTSGWKGADIIPDAPVPGAMEFLREAVEHFRVIVYSSRSHHPGGIEAMKDYIRDECADDTWEVLEFPTAKPPALVTIDDRAITFTGEWPSIDTLKNFKPWNKK